MRVINGPAVQFGLDLQYPALRPEQGRAKLVGIHRRQPPDIPASSLPDLLASFAMHAPFARPDYYEASVPPTAISRHRACPPPGWKPGGKGNRGAHRSARSASSYTPAASPRLRRRLSARPPHRLLEPAPELTRLLESGHVLHPGPHPPDWSRRHRYGASTTDSLALRLLTLLAGPGPSGSTGPSRRCRGCSRPPRRSPDQAASSFTRPLRRPGGGALPSPHEYSEVGPERPAGVTTGGSLRAASRTRRAPQSAPGSPQASGGSVVISCSARPWRWDACSPVVVARSAHSGRVEQHHLTFGGPYAVASAQFLPRGAPVLALLPPDHLFPQV